MRKILLALLLLCSSAFAQDQYNSIATAYVTTTISQQVVFNSTMQQGGTFTFSVLAHNGGGRAGQSDTANVKIQFYTSGGTLVTSVNSTYSANLPNPNAVCGNPCIDPAVPWTTLTTSATLTAAQAATVAYATISMYGIDGSYWAGDYGPWYRAPTFQHNGGGNLAYNPEFGPYNNITAQGWTSNPGFGACQGAWGGSNACIVNSSGTPGTSTTGLVANQNGGGPSSTGGTTSGQPGGYNSTMSTTSPAGALPPAPTAIYNQGISTGTYIINHYPTSNNSPSAEQAPNAFDNNPYTKYLNFDKQNAGVTVKLNQGKVVSGFTLTTANDYSGRDPTSYKLYGSNDGVTWVLISEGAVSLSEDRYWTSPTISVTNTNAYVYYYIFFPTTKAGEGCGQDCNSMQIAEITFIYDANNTTTSTATGTTVSNPGTLCCGGSADPFNASATNQAKIITFMNRTTADSQVFIEQIGNSNTITVTQSGTRNNYTKYYGNGSFNNIEITQSGNSSTQANYIDLSVNGNSNDVNLTQQSTGGGKGIFATVNNNNNSLIVNQSGSGSHYADVNLAGGSKNVDITQSGSASHMSAITLTGLPVDLSLTQAGSTQQFYSINFNCATTGGCAKITVKQGQ